MATIRNRRRHPRLPEQDQVVVTVVSARSVPALEGKTLFCTTKDISGGGVRLDVQDAVPAGAILLLRIAFDRPLRAFRLEGRVACSNPAASGKGFAVGVEFTDTASPAMAAWRDVLRVKSARSTGESAAI